MKQKIISTALISAIFIFSCSENNNISAIQPTKTVKSTQKQLNLTIMGKVELPADKFSLKTDQNTVSKQATVSLLYPSDHPVAYLRNTAIATGLTDEYGNFKVDLPKNFNPQENEVYILDAANSVGNIANDFIRLRTILKFTGVSWESITTPSLYINTKTTALAIFAANKFNDLSSLETINKITVENNNSILQDIEPIISKIKITVSQINYVVDLVNSILTSDHDPLQYVVFTNNNFINSLPQSLTPPDSPVLAQAVVNGNSTLYNAVLSWSSISGTTHYKIYRNDFAAGTYIAVTGTTYTDVNLSAPSYEYYVKVCTENTCSVNSNTILVNKPIVQTTREITGLSESAFAGQIVTMNGTGLSNVTKVDFIFSDNTFKTRSGGDIQLNNDTQVKVIAPLDDGTWSTPQNGVKVKLTFNDNTTITSTQTLSLIHF